MRALGQTATFVGVLIALISAMTSGQSDIQWSLLGVALTVAGVGLMCAPREA
ncbi:hypothetical protein ncot_02115 [Nocardioides sp. JQ2195]|uniref:hypothetical protein n=1 Tax=Nocardioides sp. JQ2195 TaxID=2592334 RepID=UPI00143E9890|nr:hypothetical protein [Nocardioides sp. JQ2195]QIX25517.1 hypothetical protein ncot_02115 [Nocardioides sp. JQ2195]